MDTSWRAQRRAELENLCFTEPVRLVMLFRRITGLSDLEPLPTDSTYASIIETILDYENLEREGKRPRKVKETRPILTLNDPTITLIEHLRSSPPRNAKRHKRKQPEDLPIVAEVFGPIDIYDEGIDWLAAARFTPGNVR